MQKRYYKDNRDKRGQLLDGMEAVLGQNRKSLIRHMNGTLVRKPRRRQRGRSYGPQVDDALRVIAELLSAPPAPVVRVRSSCTPSLPSKLLAAVRLPCHTPTLADTPETTKQARARTRFPTQPPLPNPRRSLGTSALVALLCHLATSPATSKT